MKTLLRIFLILLAAAAVVGATVALAQVEAVQAAISSGREGHGAGRGERALQLPAIGDADAAAAEGRLPGGHDAQGINLAGFAGVVKNFVIVAIVTLALAIPSALSRRRRRRRKLAAAGSPAPAT